MRAPVRLATTEEIRLPRDKEAAKRAVCKALGLPDAAPRTHIIATVDALLAALEPLQPEVIEREALRFGCSAREAKLLAQMKADPRKYIAVKNERAQYAPKRR